MNIIKGKKQYALVVNEDELAYITAAVGDSSATSNQETRKNNGYKNTKYIDGYDIYKTLKGTCQIE